MSKVLLKVAQLDVFDYVPSHAQMTGHVLDGHVAAQLQGVTLKDLAVGVTGNSKAYLGLKDHPAGSAGVTFLIARAPQIGFKPMGKERNWRLASPFVLSWRAPQQIQFNPVEF